jgi:hypothetical protein
MTVRSGSAEWHGSVEGGSGTVTVAQPLLVQKREQTTASPDSVTAQAHLGRWSDGPVNAAGVSAGSTGAGAGHETGG